MFQRATLALAGGRARPRVENGLVRAPDAAAVARVISSAGDQQQGDDRRGDGGGASPVGVDAGSAESAGAQNIQPDARERAGEAADVDEALRVGAGKSAAPLLRPVCVSVCLGSPCFVDFLFPAGGDWKGVPQAVAPSPNRPQRAEQHQRAPLRPIQAERPLGARNDAANRNSAVAPVAGAPKSRSTANPSSRPCQRPTSTKARRKPPSPR